MEDVQSVVRPKVFVGRVPPWLCSGLRLASLKSAEETFFSDDSRVKRSNTKENALALSSLKITVGVGPPTCILRNASSKPLKITVGSKPPSEYDVVGDAVGSFGNNNCVVGLTKARSLRKSGSLKKGTLDSDETGDTKTTAAKQTSDLVESSSNKLLNLLSSESIVAFHTDRVELENEKQKSTKSMKNQHISGQLKSSSKRALSKGISWSSDLCVVYPSDDSISKQITSKSVDDTASENKSTSAREDQDSKKAVIDECKEKPIHEVGNQCPSSPGNVPTKGDMDAIITDQGVNRAGSKQNIPENELAEKCEGTNDTTENVADCSVIQREDSNQRHEKLNRIKNRLSTIIRMGNMNDDEEEETTMPTDAYGYGFEHSQSSGCDLWLNKDTSSNNYDKLSVGQSKTMDAQLVRPAKSHDISRVANIRMNVIASKYNRIKDELEMLGSQQSGTDAKRQFDQYEKKIPSLWYKEAKMSISRKNDVEFKAENFPSLYNLFNKYSHGLSQGTF